MKTNSFSFDVPTELIAQHPSPERGDSRMMVLHRPDGGTEHSSVRRFPAYLNPGSVVVFNNSEVYKARVFGTARETGGKTEFLLLSRKSPDTWRALTSKARKQKKGKVFSFPGGVAGTIQGEEEGLKIIRFDRNVGSDYLEQYGHLPLPPYIKRAARELDEARYQTVFARVRGSSAAPTAGLHFTPAIIGEIERQGSKTVFLTLHVGLGTFMPIRTSEIERHTMHAEELTIPGDTAEAVDRALREGRDIVAVGTTVVRALEAAHENGRIRPGTRITDKYIYPGYRFRVVRRLFTNFHTARSSLLVLVSAFAGCGAIQRAYAEAVQRRYRFYSYGDSMLIL